jgi:hypothetical protein
VKRRVWLALLAVLLQAMAPLVPMDVAALPWPAAVLCHDPGPGDPPAHPAAPRDPESQQPPPCAICLTLHWIAADAPPAAPTLARPEFVAVVQVPAAAPSDRGFDIRYRPRIRAPPKIS